MTCSIIFYTVDYNRRNTKKVESVFTSNLGLSNKKKFKMNHLKHILIEHHTRAAPPRKKK